MPPTSSLPEWLMRASEALKAGNIDGWMEIYSPEAVHEFPFAPESVPRRLIGRDAIAAYMQRLLQRIRFGTLSDICVRESGDELIIEATGHHWNIPDDTSRDISYVWFINRRDGRVTHYRDYMNPLQLL